MKRTDDPKNNPYIRPTVSSIKDWDILFDSPAVKVERARGSWEFYRVRPTGLRPKYFFGESAWSDAERLASDYDFQAWGCTD